MHFAETAIIILTLPLIHQGGSWFNERACLSILTDRAVEVHFPQAFTGPKSRLFPSAPRYSMFLVSSDRQSDREVGMRPLARSYAAYHQFAHEQFETLVLLPKGTIYLGTQRNTIRLSVCKRTVSSIALYRKDVNMVCYRHETAEKSQNDAFGRTGQSSDCGPAGLLRSLIGQRGDPLCAETGIQRNPAAGPQPIAPHKVGPFIPQMNQGAFWAVRCKSVSLFAQMHSASKQEHLVIVQRRKWARIYHNSAHFSKPSEGPFGRMSSEISRKEKTVWSVFQPILLYREERKGA